MHKVEISEKKWGRNSLKRSKDSLNPGKMCCLGFICLQAGFTEEEITGYSFPAGPLNKRRLQTTEEVPEILRPVVVEGLAIGNDEEQLWFSETSLARQLAHINDDTNLSYEERKERLTNAAKSGGYEFVFVE